MCQGTSLGLGSFPGKREVIESSVGLVPANTLFFRMANRSFAINCAVKLNPIPLQPADTRSFIFEDLPYVAFAVQNANNVEGICLQSVINPNSLKSSDRP